MACSPPTASVEQYRLLPQTPGDELVFDKMDYSFTRKVKWTTVVQRYRDQTFDVLPNQIIAMYEFTIKMDRWTSDDIEDLEAFIDSRKGSAYPFQFTAPDDDVLYNVQFKDDAQGYAVPSATVRTGELVLVTVGDLDNTINNDAAYPDYVESLPGSSSTSTT